MEGADLITQMESALRAEGEKYEQLYHLSQDQIHLLQQDEADIDSVAELMSQKMDIVEERRHWNLSIKILRTSGRNDLTIMHLNSVRLLLVYVMKELSA